MILILFSACADPTRPGDTTGDPTGEPDPTDTDTPPGEVLSSDVARETAPSTANVAALATADNTFGWDLTRHLLLAAPDADLAVSPWSLEVAFAQAYAGADAPAKAALATLFHWTLPEPDLHEAFDATWLAVDGHTAAGSEEDPAVTVSTTSQIYFDDRVSIEPAWLDTVGRWYGTGAVLLDLDGDPEGSADAINGWVSARTDGLIPKLVSPEAVAESALILVNAVYFAASWHVPFGEAEDAAFTLRDGTEVTVPTMRGAEIAVTAHEADGWLVFDVPFSDPALVFTIVLPDAGRWDEVVAGLDWATIAAAIEAEDVSAQLVALPKFAIDSRPDVVDAILSLAGADVFGRYAGIAQGLALTGVEHQAVIEADEKGVVAAAATALEFSDSASPEPPLLIAVDRPFLWFLRDESSGTVLFSGALMDPR